MVVVKKYTTSEFSGLENITGRLLYDSSLNILKFNDSTTYNNVLIHKDQNNNVSAINNLSTTGLLGINTSNPDKQVEINSSTGDCLRLTYNDADGSALHYSDFLVSNTGNLTVTPSGGNVNISTHNGSTTGLRLNNVLVTATATELNYVDTTPGVAEASKALVVDSSRNISNINDLTVGGTLNIAGTLSLTSTVDSSSTSTGALVIAGGVGIAKKVFIGDNLNVAGSILFTNTEDATNSTTGGTLTISGGTAISKKLFVGDSLNVTNNSIINGNVGISVSSPSKKLEVNSTTGDCLRLYYDAVGSEGAFFTDLLVNSSGNFIITPSSGNMNLTTHNGSTTGLHLNGVLVTSTAEELNYVDTTKGTAEASKALVLDANRDIININYIEAGSAFLVKPNSVNNTVDYPLSLIVTPATTAGIGLGTGIEFNSVNSNNDIYNAGYINYISTNITENSETGFFDFKLANGGVIDSIMTVANNGVLTCTSMVETSDVRVKDNISDTISTESLEKILQIDIKSYHFKKDKTKKKHTGVIAQELKEIIPEAVIISQKDNLPDFHSVHYTQLIPHLINCIKELHKEILELKNK